jgi:hypothetical protein
VTSLQETGEASRLAARKTRLTMEEFFEEQAREAAGVVANDAVLFKKIVEDYAEAKLLELRKINGHGLGALRAVTAGDVRRDELTIGDDPINDAARDVFLDGAKMIGERVAGGFARLGHQVGDVDAGRFGLGDSVGNFRDEQIREDAGVERAGAEKNEVGLLDGFDDHGNGPHAARRETQFFDGCAAGGDARFAVNDAAIFEFGDEVHVRKRGWENAPADGQDFAADANGFGEIAGHVSERGEEEIAEVVADQAASGVEAILEKTAEQSFIFRKRDHAIANVAGRKNTIFAAQASGASAVVGDGDDGGEISDGALGGGVFVATADDVFLEAAKEGGETCAAAESNDPEAARKCFRIGGTFFHAEIRDGRPRTTWRKNILHRVLREHREHGEEKKRTG